MPHRMEKDVMAASITDSQAMESGGFRSTGRGGKMSGMRKGPPGGGNFNTEVAVGGQAI
jgi:hypothetical protein